MKTKLLLSLTVFAMSSLASAAAPKETPEMLEKGKASYAVNCATCHGDNGDGNGVAGAMMNPKPRNFMKDKFKKGEKPEQVFAAITKGLDGTAMTGYAHLSEDERWAITYYVLALKKGKK